MVYKKNVKQTPLCIFHNSALLYFVTYMNMFIDGWMDG